MPEYRCYLMNVGHIVSTAIILAADDTEAIQHAKTMFKNRKDHCTGFEVMERGRHVHRQDGHDDLAD